MADFIYAFADRQDVRILQEYSLDLAYGNDENSFQLTTPLRDEFMQVGGYIYQENTDIGGKIDKIKIDTAHRQVIYSGRTWHGILAGKIIEPNSGEDYLLLNGDANAVIGELLNRVGLLDVLFDVSEDTSIITITNYQIRYGQLYAVLVDMLYAFGGKLKLKHIYDNGVWKIQLSAVPYVDYSKDEEWSSSQRDFVAEKDYHPVNHMICLGSGNLRNRHVIHLFSDGASIRPYALSDNPIKDEDYILDKRNQVFFDIEEIAVVYDYPNAQSKDVYIPLTSKPADWEQAYRNYYYYDEGEYKRFEGVEVVDYPPLNTAPSDWATMPEKYYKIVDGGYVQISKVENAYYDIVSSEPEDWQQNYGLYYQKSYTTGEFLPVEAATYSGYEEADINVAASDWANYSSYYTRAWNGTEWIYTAVSSVKMYGYQQQTGEPFDWQSNYGSYYVWDWNASNYVPVQGVDKQVMTGWVIKVAPQWQANTYFSQFEYDGVPPFTYQQGDLWRAYSRTGAPPWTTGTYKMRTALEPPTFVAGTYYERRERIVPPAFGSAYMYRQDNYYDLVDNALKRFNDYLNCDKINITLSPSEQYDIGDVVGATDDITGLSVIAPITKKIVKISKNRKTVSYETGGGRT